MRKNVILLSSFVAIGLLVWLLWPRGESRPDEQAPTESAIGSGGPASGSADRRPDFKPGPGMRGPGPVAADLFEAVTEDDPPGALRLEGQVLTEDDLPVGGAIVSVSSKPERQLRTEPDGSFALDGLIPKQYRLTARKDALIGGPVLHRLSADSPPAIVRVRQGGNLNVRVLADHNGEPIQAVLVEFRGIDDQRALTDKAGLARFQGVPSGFGVVAAKAEGFADAHRPLRVPESTTRPITVEMRLEKGAGVQGTVTDETGKPVAEAKVMAIPSGEFVRFADDKREGAVTDAQGSFEMHAVAAGTYRFQASHSDHPPADSGAVTVQGTKPTRGVTIVMPAGGQIHGRVETHDGQQAPYAAVRAGPPGGRRQRFRVGNRMRQAVAKQDGTFILKGLAREELQVLAVSDGAASKIVPVDLRGQAVAGGVLLTLDEQGTIEGMVVDGNGQAVPEVQVWGRPDLFSRGAMDQMGMRGPASTTTDGGGRFKLTGLSEGSYRLQAFRTQRPGFRSMLQQGVKAETGDRDVRLVLEEPGSLRGQVVYARPTTDGVTSPPSFVVSVGFGGATPFEGTDGVFEMERLPVGDIRVSVHGSGFAPLEIPNVKIQAGQLTDLGVLRVQTGRMASGRVVEPNGNPVAGASVVAAHRLLSTGGSLTADFGPQAEARMGLIRTQSRSDGGFTIQGMDQEAYLVMAEQADLGRSDPAQVPAGQQPTSLELVLHGFGSLRGTVTSGGQPSSGAVVSVRTPSSTKQSVVVTAGENGTFVIEKLPAGHHMVSATEMSGLGGGKTVSSEVDVRVGEQANVSIDLPLGNVDLTVQVKGINNAPLDATQAILVKGQADFKTADQVNQAVLAGGQSVQSKFWLPSRPATFSKVVPGQYSLCLIPINGQMNDFTFLHKLRKNAQLLKVYCAPQPVPGSPEQQIITREVPPMEPLPEETKEQQ